MRNPPEKFLFSVSGTYALLVQTKGEIFLTRRHNDDSLIMEYKTTTWQLWGPHASESTGKEVTYYASKSDFL